MNIIWVSQYGCCPLLCCLWLFRGLSIQQRITLVITIYLSKRIFLAGQRKRCCFSPFSQVIYRCYYCCCYCRPTCARTHSLHKLWEEMSRYTKCVPMATEITEGAIGEILHIDSMRVAVLPNVFMDDTDCIRLFE